MERYSKNHLPKTIEGLMEYAFDAAALRGWNVNSALACGQMAKWLAEQGVCQEHIHKVEEGMKKIIAENERDACPCCVGESEQKSRERAKAYETLLGEYVIKIDRFPSRTQELLGDFAVKLLELNETHEKKSS
jgi:hypothetical protein